MIRSFSLNAVLVGVPVHVISASPVPNSTPSLYGPPPTSLSDPAAVRLNTRARAPMFASMFDSFAQIENEIVPAHVNPPLGTRPEIHSSTVPPAVRVHWIWVPPAAVLTTPVPALAPAATTMS
jgi:hypothetical protein